MRLLIIAGNPGLLAVDKKYNGGGWIASLQQKLLDNHGNELDMALIHFNEEFQDTVKGGCRYYTLPLEKHKYFHYHSKEQNYKNRLKVIVEKENPDVILCFGTEMPFGLVQEITDIPVLMHLQGLLTPIFEFLLPHNMNWFQYLLNPRLAIEAYMWKVYADRERRILNKTKYVLGRTEWDYKLSRMFAPQSEYIYCSEMIRPVIFNSDKIWNWKERPSKKIISIISKPYYKGVDVILRCAKVLSEYLNYEFEWDVYGINDAKKMIKITGVNPKDVNVNLKGVINAQQLVDAISEGDVFVHPSYIENSPNTVCEAQLLGIPVIATNVGGTSSIISHNETGVLTPSGDIYLLAANIKHIIDDREFAKKISENGRKVALERHNPDEIAKNIMLIFRQVVNRNNSTI